jgi:tRNA A-37 threonylcarbamoyl transferase component Bud32
VIGTLLNGRFRLEEQIGSGGMSTVYRAFDEVLERPVAIKLMHASIADDGVQLERFRREARTAAQMSHPHVVTVIDAGEDEGHPFIVLEYIEGETLKDRIRRQGPLPVPEAVAYAIEIGHALQAAHAERLVHRDVKPQNVLLDLEGRAKVTDFGISRSLDQEGLTATGRVLGTTDYVSPEQALGDTVTEQSDVYSLGVVLYEMLAGTVPFRAESQVGVAMKHVREPMPDVQIIRPQVSAALAAVVERATAKELRNRYRNVDEMLADLEQALAIEVARSGHPTGEATSVIRALPRSSAAILPARWRNPRLWGAMLALIAIGAALIVTGLVLRAQEDNQPVAGPPPPKPAAANVELTAASDFDPEGDTKSEHRAETPRAIDNDFATVWSTENYSAGGGFGNKSGVGLYVTASQPVAASRIDLWTRTPGFEVSIYAASEPGQVLADWGRPIKSAPVDHERVNIPLDTGRSRFRHYLIWITKLPSGNQTKIAEVNLLGRS